MMDWAAFWNEKAKEPRAMTAAGRSSTTPQELFSLLRHVCAHMDLREHDSLLEVGCGNGVVGRHLVELVREYHGLDIAVDQWNMFPLIGREKLATGSIVKMPYGDGYFTKVLGVGMLQYLTSEEIPVAFAEVRRVLAQGGRAVFSMNPDASQKSSYFLTMPTTVSDKNRKATEEALWFEREKLVAEARAAGFRVASIGLPADVWASWYMFDLVLW